ncbi:MAG: ArnT family glycosyltransferase [Alphaproteobacteria bacterium]
MASFNLSAHPRWLWAVFAIALAVRIVNVADIARQPEIALTEDASLYWEGARDWVASGGFNHIAPAPGGGQTYLPEHERVPGYFLFLLPLRALFGNDHIPVLIAQSLLDAVTCVLIALIGLRISRESGLLSGLLAAFWPNLIIHSGLVLTETLFLFFAVLLMLAALRFADRLRPIDAWVTGLLCGTAIMVRPVMQFIPLALMAAASLLPLLRRRRWQLAVVAPILVAIGVALPVAPQLVRNQIAFGEPRLTSQTGVHLLYWVAAQVDQIGSNTSFDDLSVRYQDELERRFATHGTTLSDATPFQKDREMRSLALEILAAQPAKAIAQAWGQGMALNILAPAILGDPRIRALKTESFMDSGGDIFSRARHLLASAPPAYMIAAAVGGIGSALTLALSALGFIMLLRRDLPLALLSAALVGYFLLITGPVAAPKYRIPFEPVLILTCAIGLAAVIDRQHRRRRVPPQPALPGGFSSGTE